jgi:hypothetical protein
MTCRALDDESPEHLTDGADRQSRRNRESRLVPRVG